MVSAVHAAAGPDPIDGLLATADAAAGQKAARVCLSCHTFDKGAPNRLGPNLWGVVGRPSGSAPGFRYSDGMTARHGAPWTYDALNTWLYSPSAMVPGTYMTFGGVKATQDRANIIAFLRTLSDQPAPLPKSH